MTTENNQTEQPEIRYLGDIRRLIAKPGDVFVLTCDFILMDEHIKTLTDIFEPNLPGHKVLVLQKGMELSVIEEQKSTDQ